MTACVAPPAPEAEDIFRLDGATVSYKTRQGEAVVGCANVSFSVQTGLALGLVGESGHGKSTILSVVCGTREPDSGSVSFAGAPYQNNAGWRASFNRAIQFVGQNPYAAFNPRLSILPQIAAPAHYLRNVEKRAAQDLAEKMLVTVGLGADVGALRPGALSGGMLQRAAIARALICEPKCLVLDEPTASLSPEGTREVVAVLQKLRQVNGCAMLVTSHDFDVIAGLCDDVLVVYRGHIVDRAPPDRLETEATNAYTRLLVEAWRGNLISTRG